jgi:hypothetical protein
MPYPGVPKELTPKMDKCVQRVMKDGKSKPSAIAICKTSIMSQKQKKKEKPMEIVADKTETRCVYFSSSPIQREKTLNASREGKLLKNVEIFKSGTYRGIQFKNSGLDKMVANFHYLKSFGIFQHVPVRADHPGFFGIGDIIDKVGGYVDDLRREGNTLVADIRVTSQGMWDKIQEGSYINRSAEIGTYDDNDGTVYSPVLYGFAWVDIPQIEGLSPKFSYSRNNKNFELINLNAIINMENMENEEPKDTFPPEESVVVEDTTIEPESQAPIETPKEEVADVVVEKEEVITNNKQTMEFEKSFPNEAKELVALRAEKLAFELKERADFVDSLEKEGKITPAQKEVETAFVKELTSELFAKYKEAKSIAPAVVKLDKEEVEGEEPAKEDVEIEKTPEEKADDFIKETN